MNNTNRAAEQTPPNSLSSPVAEPRYLLDGNSGAPGNSDTNPGGSGMAPSGELSTGPGQVGQPQYSGGASFPLITGTSNSRSDKMHIDMEVRSGENEE